MIAEEMKKRSNLVEHVARRILFRLTEKFEGVTVARIRIKKINPPLGGDIVGSVGVEMTSDEL
jgi:dihydroneopterin aldolase